MQLCDQTPHLPKSNKVPTVGYVRWPWFTLGLFSAWRFCIPGTNDWDTWAFKLRNLKVVEVRHISWILVVSLPFNMVNWSSFNSTSAVTNGPRGPLPLMHANPDLVHHEGVVTLSYFLLSMKEPLLSNAHVHDGLSEVCLSTHKDILRRLCNCHPIQSSFNHILNLSVLHGLTKCSGFLIKRVYGIYTGYISLHYMAIYME